MTRVAAIFATMNRSDTAVTCLRRLAAQTRRPWKVVVTDNGSTDGSVAALRTLDSDGLGVEVIAAGENLGNAGGIERAMEAAFAAGADAVWILDDDSWPEPEALEALLDSEGPVGGVRASLVVDPETARPSWPFQVENEGGWRLTADIASDAAWTRVRRAWLGVLISREVRELVGPVDGRLFLRGEDEDYPRRIEAAGLTTWLNVRSVLHHPPGGPMNRVTVAGRELVLDRGLSGAKLYYRLRNAWWLKRRDENAASAMVLALGHVGLLAKEGVLWKSRIQVCRAAADAWRGCLGRRDDL